jgi:putative flippase GtrA
MTKGTHHPTRFLPSLARYLTVGVANTAFSLAIIYGLMAGPGFGVDASNAIGYAFGVVLSFILNKRWTFRHSGNAVASFFKWLAVLAVAYACNLAAVHVSANVLGIDPYLSQLAGIPVYVAIGFLGSRLLVFRRESKHVGKQQGLRGGKVV